MFRRIIITDVNGKRHEITISGDEVKKLFFTLWTDLFLTNIDKDQEKKRLVKNFLVETILTIDGVYKNVEILQEKNVLKDIITTLIREGRVQIPLSEIYTYYRRPIGPLQLQLIKQIFDEAGWLKAEEGSITDSGRVVGTKGLTHLWYKPVSLDDDGGGSRGSGEEGGGAVVGGITDIDIVDNRIGNSSNNNNSSSDKDDEGRRGQGQGQGQGQEVEEEKRGGKTRNRHSRKGKGKKRRGGRRKRG